MTVSLLDVNVLLALLDPRHTHHETAVAWFEAEPGRAWASCPITENGFVRIVAQPSYPTSLEPLHSAAALRRFQEVSHHVFWPDAVSLLDDKRFNLVGLTSPRHITDIYLLALATLNGGTLVTFDRRLFCEAVTDGNNHLFVLE